MVSRQGRNAHEAVLRIFTVDPRNDDLFERPHLAIPEIAIRKSLTWFIKSGDQTLDRRIERALKRNKPSKDDPADVITRLAIEHHRRLTTTPGPIEQFAPDFWRATSHGDPEIAAALAVSRFLGGGEVGVDRYIDVLFADHSPKHKDFHALREFVSGLLIENELSGKEAPELRRHVHAEDAVARIDEAGISHIREVRDKLAFVAEMGLLYLRHRGSRELEPMRGRMFRASTESLEASMILYTAAPIAATLTGNAWHRMAALIVMILTERDSGHYEALNTLAIAAVPEIFS